MSPSLVVFDLDGTLVDSSGDLASAVNAMLARVAPRAAPLSLDHIRSFVGNGASVLVRKSLDAARVPLATEQALPVFMDAYRERLLDTTRLYDGVAGALDELRAERLAVLTNKPGSFSRAILDGLGLGGRFAEVWGPDDAGARKPDPAGLRRLLATCGAADAVMVGDSPIDVETARAAGLPCLGVAWGFDPESLRASGADAVVDAPADLPAAIRRLRGPREAG